MQSAEKCDLPSGLHTLLFTVNKVVADDLLMKDVCSMPADCSSGGDAITALQEAASASTDGAEKTKTMRAGAGRSSYVPEEALHNTADPGASAVAIWLHAVAEALA